MSNRFVIAHVIAPLVAIAFSAASGVIAAQEFPTKTIRLIVPLAPGGTSASREQGSRLRDANVRESESAVWFQRVADFRIDYPRAPIRLIVPLAPGGGNDTAARVVGHKLGEALGQQVVVDNRPGGGSVIASEIAARAPADGHTLYLFSTNVTVAPALQKKLSFDTIKDFAPITRLTIAPGALIVHPSLPVKTVKDVIALAKAKPGEITFGSAGLGSGSHLGGELFNMLAGVKLLHVPYKGSALATASVLGGETSVAFTNPIGSLPHIKAGRLRMIAVTTAQRWPLLPDLPTIAESGVPGYEIMIWNGLAAPAATPRPVIERLHRELMRILAMPEVNELLAADGSRTYPETPQAFAAFIKFEVEKWIKVIAQARLSAT